MLLRAVFLLALLATLTEAIAAGAHAVAKLAFRADVTAALHQQLESATALAQASVVAAIAGGGDPRALAPPAPVIAPVCVIVRAIGCALRASATIAFLVPPPAAATPCAAGGCAAYAQGNDAFDEGRLAAEIAVSVSAPDGAVDAQRSERVLFRTSRVEPYATFVGMLDDSSAALAGSGIGDDGGAVPAGAAPGTLIDVTYRDAVNGKTFPANVWRPSLQRAPALARGWSP